MLSSAYKLTALLLLHVGGLAAAKKNDLCERQHALTCAGGGYRAYSTCAGFLSSFLTTTEGSLDTLFEGIDTVAGVSGGSWWATGLMYSEEMPAMHEAMADDPASAGATFFAEWLANTGPIPQRRLTAEHIDPGFSFLCGYAINGRGPGDNFERYVRNPTSLLDDATLSSPPARDFAKGKLFLVLASVPTPGGEGWENEKVWVHFTYDGANQPNGSIYYSAKSSYDDDGFTLWAPAKWSVVLGDDPDAESLLPFCGREDCQGVYLHYTGYSTEHPSAVADSPPLGEIFHDAFGHPGHVLLDQVAGTSSAALASHVLDPEDLNQPGFPQVTNLDLELVFGAAFAGIVARPDVAGAVFSQDICNRQAYWTDRERSERPFSQMGDNEITQQLISETADSGLQALNDGAWTDNTGITAAVAALTSATGCNKLRRLSVTALLNGERVDLAASSLEAAGLPNLFDGSGKAHGPICSSPSYDEVIAQLDSAESKLFEGPTDESGLKLESIRYGTIKCETMDNEWYGVKGGFLVDINWIWAESNYPTTPPGGWAAGHSVFQNLAQDIVTAMVESSDETIGPLLPEISKMFFPQTFEDDTWEEAFDAHFPDDAEGDSVYMCDDSTAIVKMPDLGYSCAYFCNEVLNSPCLGAHVPNFGTSSDPCEDVLIEGFPGCSATYPGVVDYRCECGAPGSFDSCKTNEWESLVGSPGLDELIVCSPCKGQVLPDGDMSCDQVCQQGSGTECVQAILLDDGDDVCEPGENSVVVSCSDDTEQNKICECEPPPPPVVDACSLSFHQATSGLTMSVCDPCEARVTPPNPLATCEDFCSEVVGTSCEEAFSASDNEGEECVAADRGSCDLPNELAMANICICAEPEAPPEVDVCNTMAWDSLFPDLDVQVCDSCKVSVPAPDPEGNSCDEYCAVLDSVCCGAFLADNMENVCMEGMEVGCSDKDPGWRRLVCECEPPPEDTCQTLTWEDRYSEWAEECGRRFWPDVSDSRDQRCDEACRVEVYMSESRHTCDDYCSEAGFPCAGAWMAGPIEWCDEQGPVGCGYDFGFGWAICECKPEESDEEFEVEISPCGTCEARVELLEGWTCGMFCGEVLGATCEGGSAGLPESEQCQDLSFGIGCRAAVDEGSLTSCECGEPGSLCREELWGAAETCGACKVQIGPIGENVSYQDCDGYCREQVGTYARGDAMRAGTATCDGMPLSEEEMDGFLEGQSYICECAARSDAVEDRCLTGGWPAKSLDAGVAAEVCDSCVVQVTPRPGYEDVDNCKTYCNGVINATCWGAWRAESEAYTCWRGDYIPCDKVLEPTEGGFLAYVCECDEPDTYDSCETAKWPGETSVCRNCVANLADTIEIWNETYGTCGGYCATLGRSCVDAWISPGTTTCFGFDDFMHVGCDYDIETGYFSPPFPVCECSREPTFYITPQLLFRSSGLASAYNNMWPGWYMADYEGMQTNGKSKLTYGKQSAYDELCLHALTLKDANGTYATYVLYEEYRGMTLLQIVQKCMPRGSMDEPLPPDYVKNTGMDMWFEGHCEIGHLTQHHGRPFARKLRLFVGDGIGERDDYDDWAIFMPLMGNGKGDFQESDTWAFGSKGETCTGYQNMVSIEGYKATECAYMGDM